MIRWDRAFPDEKAMKGHIQAASQFVACARKSLDSAIKYRNGMASTHSNCNLTDTNFAFCRGL